MPVADGFPDVDAVEDGGGERLDPGALLGQDALAFPLEEAPVVLDDKILGWVGADSVAVQLAGPLAGDLFLPARFQPDGAEAALLAREAPA
jgi:hypothetical protein